ncbi:uncharacterized protein UBRO_07863 [Ustilago bromivora]|uniref:Zn(2)-C6 fungal-type domain-containing protein n=1 Tax=Ustilago bromivora TaxID=307758 RepID=A0A1K0GD10_9BASI|nr:uncharacterized protein UBRO_07863 [Ustilago bromivora]
MTRKTRSSTQRANEAASAKKEPDSKRERSLRACTRCRQRKQRCDNALPHCSNCLRGGVPCESFPVSVGSQEEILHLHDQLQESSQQIDAMQEELSMARLVVLDDLSLFSVLVVKKLSDDARQGNVASRQGIQQSSSTGNFVYMNISDLQNCPVELSTMADVKPKISLPKPSGGKNKIQGAGEKLDLWKAVELLESCFPAVAPAITFAVENLVPKASSGRWPTLVDIALRPLTELVRLLGCDMQTDPHVTTPDGYPVDAQVSLKDSATQLFEATDMTRVAALMLWALLAVVKNRPEELVRLDNVLTHFMQVWEKAASADPAVLLGVIPISFRRMYDWMHLQTAIMSGKLHIQLTRCTSFEGIDAIASKSDFQTFLAACHVEQKRLEYDAIHLLAMLRGTITDDILHDAVQKLLCELKRFADVFADRSDSFVTSVNVAINTRQALMRQKLGIQLYGLFPRMLHKYCPNDRQHSRWLINATQLASITLSYHRSAFVHTEWLGDHAHDALTFVELLNAFAWLMQMPQRSTNSRGGLSEPVQTAIEVGERFASKWAQHSANIQATITRLGNLGEEQPTSSGLTTPWQSAPSHTTSSSPDASSTPSLETPHANDQMNPYATTLAQPLEWQQQESQSQIYSQAQSSVGVRLDTSLHSAASAAGGGGEEGCGASMGMQHSNVYTRNDGTHIYGHPTQNVQQWACSPALMACVPLELQERATASTVPLQPSYTVGSTSRNASSNSNTTTNSVLWYMDDRVHSKP